MNRGHALNPGNPVILLSLSLGSLQIARSLGSRGIRVYGIDSNPRSIAARSRYVEHLASAPREEEQLTDFLRAFSRSLSLQPVLIPLSDEYVCFLLKFRQQLLSFARFPMNTDAVTQLASKTGTARLLHSLGTRHPRSVIIPQYSRTIPERPEREFPCILKPDFHDNWERIPSAIAFSRTRGGRALKIQNERELREAVSHLSQYDSLVLQEMIPGPAHNNYYYVGYRDQSGRIAASYVGRKIRTMPDGMGSETLIQTIHDSHIQLYGDSVLHKTNYHGPAGIELKRDSRDGSLVVIEVNCRFGLNDAALIKKSIDLPWVYYLDALGLPPPTYSTYRTGLTWYCFDRDLDWMRTYAKEKGMNWISWMAGLVRGYDSYATFDWRDPQPFVSSLTERLSRLPCFLARLQKK